MAWIPTGWTVLSPVLLHPPQHFLPLGPHMYSAEAPRSQTPGSCPTGSSTVSTSNMLGKCCHFSRWKVQLCSERSSLSKQSFNKVAVAVAVIDIIINRRAMIQHGASSCLHIPAIPENACHLRPRGCQLQIPMGAPALGNWIRILLTLPGSMYLLALIRNGSFQSAPGL